MAQATPSPARRRTGAYSRASRAVGRTAMPVDPIERWEWEGGAVAAEPALPHDTAPASAVELDDLEPFPSAGRVDHDDVAHPPAEQCGPDRRLVGDLTRLRVALA